jgi:selenocysteine-specific elongation factor
MDAPGIVPVMVGTAGHVHHGKSSLVKLLTGCDTMRLPEERRRALTIELGYAPCTLGGNRLVGIVDVPGHEDFIRTMVAGASCIDVLLLVVAADDGPMPQTLEHLSIVATLRSPRAIAVVSKIDLVTPERAVAVADEVRVLLTRAGFPDAPVLCASNRSGDGMEHVYEALEQAVAGAALRPADPRAFRLDVERAFSATGHGTVATGVARCGAAAIGDALEVLPAGHATQLKGAQAYRHLTERVGPGTCTALNLRDLPDQAVGRGMTIALPGVYGTAGAAVVWLHNVSGDLALRRRQEVRLHAGTADSVALARLLDVDALAPGAGAAAVLSPREALVLAAGDRVLLRLLSPPRTVAGGVVLAIRSGDPGRDERDLGARALLAHACLGRGDLLGSALHGGPEPIVTDAEVLRLTQLPPAAARPAVTAYADLIPLGRRGGGAPSHWLFQPRLGEVVQRLDVLLQDFHRTQPNVPGMPPVQVAEALHLPAACAEALLPALVGPVLALRHGLLARTGFAPALPPRLADLRQRVLTRIIAAGVAAPARGNLLTELACAEIDLDTVSKLLVAEGEARQIGANLMHAPVLERCRGILLGLFATAPAVELPAFRAATGLSRNLGVEVLEIFDREGLTRRQGQVRMLIARR